MKLEVWRHELKRGDRVIIPSSTCGSGLFEGIVLNRKRQRLLIKWNDAASFEEWCSVHDAEPPSDCDLSAESEVDASDEDFEEDDEPRDQEDESFVPNDSEEAPDVDKDSDMLICFGMDVRTGQRYKESPLKFVDIYMCNEEFIDYAKAVVKGVKPQTPANIRRAKRYCEFWSRQNSK